MKIQTKIAEKQVIVRGASLRHRYVTWDIFADGEKVATIVNKPDSSGSDYRLVWAKAPIEEISYKASSSKKLSVAEIISKLRIGV